MKRLLLIAALVLSATGRAQVVHDDGRWSPWKFVIGEWVGEGTGDPGQATGRFSLQPDLHNTVLVRRNFSDYPATKDRPAFSHEDLMVIFYENGKPEAIYFDNENHVIRYGIEFSADSSSIIFLSDRIPASPRFRFTYSKAANDILKISFEIAPADRPEGFSRYIEATARRKR